MRRAAVLAFRTARRGHVRRSLTFRPPLAAKGDALGLRFFHPSLRERQEPLSVLHASLYFRSFTIALVSSLVASGAWFAYREKPSEAGLQLAPQNLVSSSSVLGSLFSPVAFSTSERIGEGTLTTTAEQTTETKRRALVVDNDEFFTGDIIGDEPISKETGDSGRLHLEMLSPDQATSKIRQREQSYLIGRGRGVVRYDVTQVPSNSPIEDDHAEKIIEVPGTVTPPEDGLKNTDWMFWGVFDGHRYVAIHLIYC